MESSRELDVSRHYYITRNVPVMPFHVSLSLKVVTHANCMIERGKFCTTKSWKAGSPLAYLTTRFVLRIMRTLQAVWVFCLKITAEALLNQGGCQRLVPAEPKSGFAAASVVTHARWGLRAVRGNILNVVRNLLTLGILPWGHYFDKPSNLNSSF